MTLNTDNKIANRIRDYVAGTRRVFNRNMLYGMMLMEDQKMSRSRYDRVFRTLVRQGYLLALSRRCNGQLAYTWNDAP